MEVYIHSPLRRHGVVHQMPLMFSISWIVQINFPLDVHLQFLVMCEFEL
jgi:hypothetical protein